MARSAARGRPRASSRSMLEDAALDLFVEQSYAGTTVEQIAQRAGVSRNTFFNYFESKSDVFWVLVDDRLAELPEALAAVDPSLPVMPALREALLAVGAGFGPSTVPWALTQTELIGSVHELQASALSRLVRQAEVVAAFAERRSAHPLPSHLTRALAYAAVGAAVAAVQAWAAAGPTRGELVPYLDEALAPVCSGFAPIVG
ncbi:TetR family transcriptional regulator [Rathayibacter sp. VKM Ac-2759]|uniref:TetR/AcrR family transcriptional regulator n=1 Tax=Rathayibacter sp. VKM Ac-2759 TaxID=2609252 RepID=UPI001318FB74|nr:TetR/AcrR family transcriptional regulator [Rathayibacter sp. VKM Ac-2759]QHC66762.1 TetR family transcriptional regulator [Rathayibacter sp. VKM Ac-2759]